MPASDLPGSVSRAALAVGFMVVLAAGSACGASYNDQAGEPVPKIMLSQAEPAGSSSNTDGEPVPRIVLSQGESDLDAQAEITPEVAGGIDTSGLTFELFDGGTGDVGDYLGTPLVVNFFAAWCPPCVREMPEFQTVFESLEGRVAFLGLSQDQDPADALRLVESTGVTYDVGWDPDLEVYRATGSIAMPTTAFVSASGKLVDTFAGALDAGSLAQRIEDALGVTAPQ